MKLPPEEEAAQHPMMPNVPESSRTRLQATDVYRQTSLVTLMLPLAFVPVPPVLWAVFPFTSPEKAAIQISWLPQLSVGVAGGSLLVSLAVALLLPRLLAAQSERWLNEPPPVRSMVPKQGAQSGHPGLTSYVLGLAILELPLPACLGIDFIFKTGTDVFAAASLFFYAGLSVLFLKCRPLILEATLAKLHQLEKHQEAQA